MRLIQAILVALFLVSVIPLEAFCHDEHCKEASTACSIDCHHAVSHNVVIPAQQSAVFVTGGAESFLSYQLTYKNPTLLSLKKPPIVLS
jgi:hypothetical protein